MKNIAYDGSVGDTELSRSTQRQLRTPSNVVVRGSVWGMSYGGPHIYKEYQQAILS